VHYSVRDFGALGNGVADDWPAFQKALDAMKPVSGSRDVHGGGVLMVPAGNYFLSRTLRVTQEVQILGISGYPGNGAFQRFVVGSAGPALVNTLEGWPGGVSRLMFPRGVTGILIAQGGTAPAGVDDPLEKGQGTTLRNLLLVSADGPDPTTPRGYGHGVSVKSRVVIDNCHIFNFAGNGLHFVAPSDPQDPDATRFNGEYRDLKHRQLGDLYLDNTYEKLDTAGNAYLFRANAIPIDSRVMGTMCRRNLLNGVYVFGSNAGTMIFESVHCLENTGHGFFDSTTSSSNLYVNCHAQGNKRGDYYCLSTVEIVDEFGMSAWQGGKGSTFINCYQEGASGGSRIYGPAIVIGGSLADDGYIETGDDPDLTADARRLGVSFSPPSVARHNAAGHASSSFPYGVSVFGGAGDDHSTKVQVELGGSLPDVAMTLKHQGTGLGYDLTYNTPLSPGWWSLVFGGATGGASPLRFSTDEADVKARQVWFDNGLYIGGNAVRIKLTVAASPHSAEEPTGGWKKGDRILNRNPVPTDPVQGFAGWICASEAPVTWMGFGELKALP
jgi:hypothetical protein